MRLYQRALRCDPNALPIIREIVPLAFNLDRPNEAVRYALKAAELDPSDPLLLRQLGLHLAEAGRFPAGARAVHPGPIESSQPAPQPGLYLVVDGAWPTVLRNGPRAEAAEAFAIVLPAIENPDKFGLNDNQRKLFVGAEGMRRWN